MKIFKKVITIIIAVILTLILSFNIFNFVSINILGNELPTINGYAYLEVVSGSMEPNIRIGDIVIIDTKVNDYKVKDIVTFKDINGSFVTHRIMEIKDEEIITQGDANNTIDDSITKEQLVGRYVDWYIKKHSRMLMDINVIVETIKRDRNMPTDYFVNTINKLPQNDASSELRRVLAQLNGDGEKQSIKLAAKCIRLLVHMRSEEHHNMSDMFNQYLYAQRQKIDSLLIQQNK